MPDRTAGSNTEPNSVTTGRMIGFSDQDVNVNYNTIDYALYTSSVNAAVVVYENGSSKGTFRDIHRRRLL